MKKQSSKKPKPLWDSDYYVARKDCITLYLWVVKRRSDKSEVAGGWTDKWRAEYWLKVNWEKQLSQDIESILLS